MSSVTSSKSIDTFVDSSLDISVVLVVWQNEQYLKQCLDALQSQLLQPKEVVVVFNGDDVSKDYFDGYDLRFEFFGFRENVGFAKANNVGVGLCSSEWVALLNVDAFPYEGWLERLQQATLNHPDMSTFASKQLQYNNPELLDGIGDSYHISGLIWREGYGQKAEDSDVEDRDVEDSDVEDSDVEDRDTESKEIFSACAAAVLYKKAAFEAVGGFDEDYFSYSEDIDLGFRLRLQGYKCLYVPTAIVEHVGSASTGGQHSDFAIYHGHRNLVWTFVKNMPLLLLLICLPLHIALNLVSLLYFSLKGQAAIIFKAKRDALVSLPVVLRKRKTSLANRKMSVLDLWSFLEKRLKAR